MGYSDLSFWRYTLDWASWQKIPHAHDLDITCLPSSSPRSVVTAAKTCSRYRILGAYTISCTSGTNFTWGWNYSCMLDVYRLGICSISVCKQCVSTTCSSCKIIYTYVILMHRQPVWLWWGITSDPLPDAQVTATIVQSSTVASEACKRCVSR